MKKETHLEYSERVLGKKPPVPCTVWTLTFGGRCLNCGYDPDEENRREKESVLRNDE